MVRMRREKQLESKNKMRRDRKIGRFRVGLVKSKSLHGREIKRCRVGLVKSKSLHGREIKLCRVGLVSRCVVKKKTRCDSKNQAAAGSKKSRGMVEK